MVSETGQAPAGGDGQRSEADQEDPKRARTVAVYPASVRRAKSPEQDDQGTEDVDRQREGPQAAVATEGGPAGDPRGLRVDGRAHDEEDHEGGLDQNHAEGDEGDPPRHQ